MIADVGGRRIGYESDGIGPALVLLHAFPLNRAMWRPQVAALRDRFAVITPDFRGFGESELPRGPLTMDDYAGDILGLLDALGQSAFIVGGCSLGGYVAFRVIARAPERVRALIIADSRAEPDADEGRRRRQAAIERIDREGPAGFVEEFAASLVGPTTKARRPGIAAALRQIIGAPAGPGLTAALAAMAGRPDSRPLLASITVPTLVVVGEEDALTPPAAAEDMAKGIAGAKLAVIPAAGHLSSLEVPEAFNRVAREFLLAL